MGIFDWLGWKDSPPDHPHIADTANIRKALSKGHCPDCGHTKFYEGPHGGSGVNILCAWCGHEFCLCEPFPQMSLRNSSEFQPERNWAFGLPEEWKPESMPKEKANVA